MDHSTHHLKPPSPLFPLPLPPFQTRVDKENSSSGSQDLRLYLRMQADRRCYSAHSTTNLDPQQLPRSNETETISPIRNRLPSRPLPSPRLPSTEISRSAVAKTWLPKRRRGLCSGVKRTTSRGFCDAARGASSRSPDHCRRLCWLSTRPTDRLDRCWPWSVCPVWKRVSMGGCNKGSVHTRISELYYCILEWMTDRLWITFPFDPCWYLLSFRVITTSRDWSWQYLNSTSKVQIEKVRTYCNCNEKEWLTEITQQPIAVSTQINVTYINHMNSIWVHMNCYCCLLWLLFWRHIWEIKSLWVYSPEQYHCLWDRMRVVLGCLGVFWFYGILKKEYLAYISKNSPLSIFTKKGSLNKK